MLPSDQRPPGQDYLMRRIADLEAAVRELRADRRMESATIGAGGITVAESGSVTLSGGGSVQVSGGGSINVQDGDVEVDGGRVVVYDTDGNIIAKLGDLGSGYRGTWLGRAGGSVAIAAYGTGPGAQSGFVGLYDRSGNYVVTDDAHSARGVARPYIPIPVTEITAPQAATSSATFTDIGVGVSAIQHPVMYAYVLVYASDASTAGEIRLAVDSTPVGPTVAIPAGSFTYFPIGPFALTVSEPTYGAIHSVTLQARRTAGTGTIAARVLSLLGLESSFVP